MAPHPLTTKPLQGLRSITLLEWPAEQAGSIEHHKSPYGPVCDGVFPVVRHDNSFVRWEGLANVAR